MSKTIVLDIETIADECVMDIAGYVPAHDIYPPWPLLQIACVSLLTIERVGFDERTFTLSTYSRAEMNERVILTEVERALGSADQVVTYNGRGFDTPVLLARAARCELDVPAITRLHSRVRPGAHLDLLDVVSAYGASPRPKLAHLCAGLRIPVKLEATGGGVAALAAAGDWRAIGRYCETDVVATWLAWQLWDGTQFPGQGRERWSMLADWIRSDQPRLEHLLPYAALPPEDGGGPRLGPDTPQLVF